MDFLQSLYSPNVPIYREDRLVYISLDHGFKCYI